MLTTLTDYITNRRFTHDNQNTVDSGPPSGIQIIDMTYRQGRDAGTLLFNVLLDNLQPFIKTITVSNFANLVADTSTLMVGSKTYTFVTSGAAGDQINIGGSNNATATAIRNKIASDLVTSELQSAQVSTNVITLTGLADGTDFNLSTNAATALTLTTTQTGYTASGSAKVQIWVYDGLFGMWCKSELLTFPPPDAGDNKYPFAAKSIIAGQIPGITVTDLSGSITISAVTASRSVGGSF